MSTTYISAAPGHTALYFIDGKLIRRTVVGWDVSGDYAWPVTLLEDANGSLIKAVRFPDGHVESVDGQRRWATLDEFRWATGL